jgi:hypothetical protein
MPYIPSERRVAIDAQLAHLKCDCWDAGEAAYALFCIFDRLLGVQRWATICTVSGIVNETYGEWRRQRVSLYEAKKRMENGDI